MGADDTEGSGLGRSPDSRQGPASGPATTGVALVMARLISGFAHEINNPLTAAQGLASLIAAEIVDPQQREDAETIHEETQRAVQNVREFRTLARFLEDPSFPAPLNDVLTHVHNLRLYEIRARGMEVELDLDTEHPRAAVPTSTLVLALSSLMLRTEEVLAAPQTPRPALTIRSGSSGNEAFAVFEVARVAEQNPPAGEDVPDFEGVGAALCESAGGTFRSETAESGEMSITASFPAA